MLESFWLDIFAYIIFELIWFQQHLLVSWLLANSAPLTDSLKPSVVFKANDVPVTILPLLLLASQYILLSLLKYILILSSVQP